MKVMGYRNGEPTLIDLELIDDRHYLQPAAARAFRALKAAAEAANHKIHVNTAWRSHGFQQLLYEKYQAKIQAGEHPAPVAKPGFSNHEFAIAVDIDRQLGDNPKTDAPDSPLDLWMNENAGKFGFVHPFKSAKTEPWHWEYHGQL
jgi:D-alanyl-D-alanine carboxypeptidase